MGKVLHDLFGTFPGAARNDHGPVKLDDIERQLHDSFHVGIAGAEIIQVELNSLAAEFVDLFLHDHEIRFTAGFGQLKGDIISGDTVGENDSADIITEAFILQLQNRYIDTDPVDLKPFLRKTLISLQVL